MAALVVVGAEPGKNRCRFHGGRSTGPRTEAGRIRIAEAQRKRWLAYREGKLARCLQNGRRFVCFDKESLLFIDLDTDSGPRSIRAGLKGCYVTAISPAGDLIAAGDGDDAIVVEAKTGKVLHRVKADEGFAGSPGQLQFTPDGQALVIGFRNVLRVLQLSTGRIVASTKIESLNAIDMAPDNKSLLVAGSETFNSSVDHRSLSDLGLINRLRLKDGADMVKPAIFSIRPGSTRS